MPVTLGISLEILGQRLQYQFSWRAVHGFVEYEMGCSLNANKETVQCGSHTAYRYREKYVVIMIQSQETFLCDRCTI